MNGIYVCILFYIAAFALRAEQNRIEFLRFGLHSEKTSRTLRGSLISSSKLITRTLNSSGKLFQDAEKDSLM